MMTLSRRRAVGWGLLAAFILAGAGWLAHLDFAQKVSTDVLDLLPREDRDPELAMVRELASQTEARVMLFVLTEPDGAPAPAAAAAAAFATALKGSGHFADAVALGDTASRDALGRAVFGRRMELLFPIWLHERTAARPADDTRPLDRWLADDAAARLSRFTATPAAMAWQDAIPADPLLMLPDAMDRVKGGLALVDPAAPVGPARALVWARLEVSPLSEAGQQPVFAAIGRATTELQRAFPGVVVAYTGVNRFAAASRARIEREVSWLNFASLLAVLAVASLFVRQVLRGLHLVPVVLLAVLGAWVGATLAFDRLHIIVFVIGSLLTGVAIDYGFYLYMQPPAFPEEPYWSKVRRLLKPLLASCFTTVTGFALLLASELPMIRQLGVFVGAGLVSALGGAIVYFSTLRRPYLEPREFRTAPRLASGRRHVARRVLVVLWLMALPGLWRLTWRDDIRELEIPSPEVQREDARVRAQFGEQEGRTIYLTRGHSLREARAALESLHTWLRAQPGVVFANLGAVVPTAEEIAAAQRFLREYPDFPERLRAAMNATGFDAAEFAPFFTAFAEYEHDGAAKDLDPLVRDLANSLTGPAGLLVHAGDGLNWFVTLASAAPAGAPPADTHTVAASQLQTLNRLFARYRESALRLSALGLAIVGLGVLATYRIRDGLRIFAIPCGTCLGLCGLAGWVGEPLNLFHLLGAFLGVCLTHNYSIFSATSAYRGEPPPVSVRVSALTAAASFGVLALSSIPVVHALGLTVAGMVLAALLVIELEHLAPLAKRQ